MMHQAMALPKQEVSNFLNTPSVPTVRLESSTRNLNLRLTTNTESESLVRRIAIVSDRDSQEELKQCVVSFEGHFHYEVSMIDSHVGIENLFGKSSPDLVVADWNVLMQTVPRVKTSAAGHSGFHFPVLFIIDKGVNYPEATRRYAGEGLIDCVRKPIDPSELQSRVLLLLGVTERLRCAQQVMQSEIEGSNRKHLESHLEALIYTDTVKDKFLEEVSSLTPYLNNDGKMKLKQLARQLRWALNDENAANYLSVFDRLNAHLYQEIDRHCATVTRNEKRLCALLLRDHTNSDIARIMGKTQNSINVAFARLRVKFGFSSNKDMHFFLSCLS